MYQFRFSCALRPRERVDSPQEDLGSGYHMVGVSNQRQFPAELERQAVLKVSAL